MLPADAHVLVSTTPSASAPPLAPEAKEWDFDEFDKLSEELAVMDMRQGVEEVEEMQAIYQGYQWSDIDLDLKPVLGDLDDLMFWSLQADSVGCDVDNSGTAHP